MQMYKQIVEKYWTLPFFPKDDYYYKNECFTWIYT
jgi:hypothetical protein